MTISSTSRKAGPYIGSGAAATFPFAFKVFSTSDIEVVRLEVSTTLETVLVLTADYTAILNADQNSNPGGSITLVAGPLAAGFNLVLTSDVANLQGTDLTNQGGFYPEVINDSLDRATIQIQQLQEEVDRSAKLPITSAEDANALVADIVRLADSADNLDTDAINIGSINTVAAAITNVNTVATNVASVNTAAGSIANINATATNIANVNAVGLDLLEPTSEINTVAVNITNVNSVGDNISNVNTVAGNNADVTTVAGDIGNVNIVGAAIANINTTAANIANVNAVGSDLLEPVSEINTVAVDIANVNTVGTNISNVNTVAGINANVTTVAGISADVTTVSTNNANVTAVSTNIANVNAVAGNSSNINAVNANSTNINAVNANSTNIDAVAGNAADITTVAGNNSNVTAVAGNSTNINAVVANATNINAVNANSANINTVAANDTAVSSVSTNMTAVTSAYTNLAAIIDAPTQAAAAASSASAAAASAASGMYSAVQDKSADYTILAADAGDLIRVTTTGGAVAITLPLIGGAGIDDGFKIAVVKWTADANAVNIARSGADTINGATTAQIGSQYSQIIFVADAETSTWFASQSGLGATNVNIDNFSGDNSTVAFTLTSDPSTENNTAVYIDGVYQQKNTYSVSGTTLTFSAAPPTGTTNIEVAYATPLAIGTPSDGTVTTAKMVDGAVTTVKIADGSVTAAKMAAAAAVGNLGYTPVNKAGDTITGGLIVDGNMGIGNATPTEKLDVTGTVKATAFVGGGSALSGTGGLVSMQSFTGSLAVGTSYTWTKPAGVTKVRVYVVGGGGGSQNIAANVLATGGAGGLSIAIIDVSSISSATVTIGNGGGGSSTGGVRGGTGGTSSFGSYATSTGGEGGISTSAPYDGGRGGVGTTSVGGAVLSTFNQRGNGGQRGNGPNTQLSGAGSYFGGGGVGAHDVGTTASEFQHGEFGGGGGSSQYTMVVNGGAGVVYVEEYA